MTKRQVWKIYGCIVGGWCTYAILHYLMTGSAYVLGTMIGLGIDIVVFGAIAAFITTRFIKQR